MTPFKNKEIFQSISAEIGFDSIGFSPAGFLEEEAPRLEKWLKNQNQGQMSYMENHFDKRLDPRLILPGAKSVVSFLHNYFPGNHEENETDPLISKYALGEDYHRVLKRKLHSLISKATESIGEFEYRVFTDSAPVMDKVWAQKSGLGWIGKNTNLISPQKGSWFFIGEIITDLQFEYDGEIKDYCGTCTKCIDACPTNALTPYQIDARKCISYLTIELKEKIPEEFRKRNDNWVYGCDICQDVCPWNRFSQAEKGDFKPLSFITDSKPVDWVLKSNSQFNKMTRPSAMSRVRKEKLKDNLDAAGFDILDQ